MEPFESGVGQLFSDPDPDNARAFFRTKSRKMTNKVMDVKSAVAKFAHDGDYLAIGGFGANRIPTAVCHELVRQGRKKMGYAGHTSTHDFQVLSAGKVFDRLDASYVVGLEARGLSPNARKYLQSGDVTITEWSNYGLAMRFKAAAMGVAYLPMRTSLGTQTYTYSAAKTVKCPFTDEPYMAVPALYPDVAAIHVHAADIYGNCQLKGITIADLDVARSAKRLIITTEKIISNEEIRREPIKTVIPFYLVDAVCEVPYGSYPGNMAYEYFSDEDHIQEWMRVEKDPEAFKEFLDKNIYQCKNHFDYLRVNGGMEKMQELRQKELLVLENEGSEEKKNG
jgi:glutaconate CoA-transferase subunit A